MDFQYLYNTEGYEFNIEFSNPVGELEISDTISFPGATNWDRSEVEHVKRVTSTYYIIECNDCIIRLEAKSPKVYVLIHDKNQTRELRKLIMYKDETVTNIDDEYATGIKHLFEIFIDP